MTVITEEQFKRAIRIMRESAERQLEAARRESGMDNIAHRIRAAALNDVADCMEQAIEYD